MKPPINGRLFIILLSASLFSVALLIPLLLSFDEKLAHISLESPFSFFLFFLQNLIFFSIILYVGLRLAPLVGFRMPLLEAWTQKKPLPTGIGPLAIRSALVGMLIGAAVIFTSLTLKQLGIEGIPLGYLPFSLWQQGLIILYGSITEEVIIHLFFMTLISWVSMKITSARAIQPAHIWFAIVMSSLLLGIGHLPGIAGLIPINNEIIFHTFVLDAITGSILGWLYWQYGLESAMIAHFFSRVVLLLIFPLFLRLAS